MDRGDLMWCCPLTTWKVLPTGRRLEVAGVAVERGTWEISLFTPSDNNTRLLTYVWWAGADKRKRREEKCTFRISLPENVTIPFFKKLIFEITSPLSTLKNPKPSRLKGISLELHIWLWFDFLIKHEMWTAGPQITRTPEVQL